jgi:hypothetical protein
VWLASFASSLLGSRADRWLFALLFLFSPYAAKDFMNPNAISRLGLAHSLATRAELNIDAVAQRTVDKAQHGDHFYCDKAPGISFLCVPAVASVNLLADQFGLTRSLFASHTGRRTARYLLCGYACLLASSAWIHALSVVLFRRALLAAGVDAGGALLITLIFAFGTPPLLWSTTLFGHAAAAGLLFSAFALYWLERAAARECEPGPKRDASPRPGTPWRWPLAGLLLGWAGLVEFTAFPIAAMVGCFMALSDLRQPGLPSAWRRLAFLFLGALGPLLALLIYNALAFGHPLKLGYASIQGFAGMRSGFFGISLPSAETALAILFGAYRGVFWLSPILLVAFVACVRQLRDAEPERSATWLALAISAYYVCLNAGYAYWDGGWSTGPRHITPIAPFLMFGLGLSWQRQPTFLLRSLIWITGVPSMLIATTCALVRVTAPADGAPMLSTHIWPGLLAGHAHLLPHRVGVSFHVSYAFALLTIAAVSCMLLRRSEM